LVIITKGLFARPLFLFKEENIYGKFVKTGKANHVLS